MLNFIEAAHALRDALYYEAGRPSLSLQMTMPGRWFSPGLTTKLEIRGYPLRMMLEDVHDFSGIDVNAVVDFIETLVDNRVFARKSTTARLKALAPRIRWGVLNTPFEHKIRLFQAMELAHRAGGTLSITNNGQFVKLKVGDWSAEVTTSNAVILGRGKDLRRRVLKGQTKLSWAGAMHESPGFSKQGTAYLSSFALAMTKELPKYKDHVDLICRTAATSSLDLTGQLMEMFEAPKEFRRGGNGGKRGQTGVWRRMSEVVDAATTNPIRSMVRYLRSEFTASEVYRLFGQPSSAAGGPFPPEVRAHFLDVIADLEAGYVRTRHTLANKLPKEDEISEELAELLAIQESLR